MPDIPRARPVVRHEIEMSAKETLERKLVLKVSEASYILNVGKRTIYDMVEQGRLDALKESPLRVTAESVKRHLELREP